MSECVYCKWGNGMPCCKEVHDHKGVIFSCSRRHGHVGPCVACGEPDHNLTNVAEPDKPIHPKPIHPSSPLETQVGGDHYKSMKIQPAEFCHANGIGLLEGLIIKYTVRHRAKGKAEDLRKAKHCIDLLLKLEYGEV